MSDWDETEHPRDTRGRFRDKSGGWVEQVADRLVDPGYVRGQPIDLDPDVIERLARVRARDMAEFVELGSDRVGGDSRLAEIAQMQGWDAPGETGTPQQLQDLLEQGGVRLWRGVTPPVSSVDWTGGLFPGKGSPQWPTEAIAQTVRDHKTGPVRYGYGIYGNGMYTSVNADSASAYAMDGEREAAIRMVLRPGARVAQWEDREEWYDEYERRLGEMGLPEDTRRNLTDYGLAAMLLGYDAIHVPPGWDDGTDWDDAQYVVLNRTAVLFEAEPGDDWED